MIYVFDSSSFIVMGHYFPQAFPSFWTRLENAVDNGRVISVREVLKETDQHCRHEHLQRWIDAHRHIFLAPSSDETEFVAHIFSLLPFQSLVKQKQVLAGGPAADPFVIASAKIQSGCAVTEERERGSAVRIPMVCQSLGIDCINLEQMMEREGWAF